MPSPLRSAQVRIRRVTVQLRLLATRRARHAVASLRASRRFVLALASLLVVLAVMAYGPLRSLDIADRRVQYLSATRHQLTKSIAELEERRERLNDPEEIEVRARREFGMHKPGEIPYIVVAPEDEMQQRPDVADPADEQRAWYEWLVDAFERLFRP